MRKRSQPAVQPRPNNPSEFFDKYDAKSLIAALNTFENQLGWELFKSFVYYQAAVHGTMSNAMIQQSNKTMEACAAGAKAEVLREVVDQFMELLKRSVAQENGVIEQPVPEEV
jgi:hypothetical protein